MSWGRKYGNCNRLRESPKRKKWGEQKTEGIGIELRNSNFPGVFWGLGSFIRLATVAINHCANLPCLRESLTYKLVHKPPSE